tara:strand:+ start:8269 stop:9507 length:1239 start_codon:yes stop_codon:yes gene_type:complete
VLVHLKTALKRLGIEHEVEFACDIDKYARTSYQVLHNPKQMFEDITTRPMDFPQLDLYVAGFPCQSFSIAGQRKGFDCPTNGTLFYTLSEFIKINQPKCFILENVKGLINHDNGRTFQIIKDKLSGSGGSVNEQMFLTDMDGLGYHIHFKVLNTKDFGLPQNRERIFIVGFKEARHFSFPISEPLTIRLKDILQDNPNSKYRLSSVAYKYLKENQKFNKFKPLNSESDFVGCITARCNKVSTDNNFIVVDEKYYLSDKMIENFTPKNGKNGIYGDLNKGGERGVVYGEDSKYMSCLTATDYKQPKQIIVHSTHTRSANRPSVQNNKNAGGSGHLSKNDGTTYCLDTQNSQAVESNKKIRRLTPLECFRLQGFTDEEHSVCEDVQSDTQLYKQMGNTISVPVIQAILKNIYDA